MYTLIKEVLCWVQFFGLASTLRLENRQVASFSLFCKIISALLHRHCRIRQCNHYQADTEDHHHHQQEHCHIDRDSQSNLICVVSITSISNTDAIIATTIIIITNIISILIILIIGGHHRHLCGHWASWRRLTLLTFFQMLAIPPIKLIMAIDIVITVWCIFYPFLPRLKMQKALHNPNLKEDDEFEIFLASLGIRPF